MEKMMFAYGGPMSPMEAVPFADRAKLLTDDNLGNKIGYTVMFDGTGYVSDITKMPGVTVEMLNWYIAWRGINPDNYKAIMPEKHISAMSMQGNRFEDEDYVGAEKYWDTTQTVMTLGDMGPVTEFMNFKCPYDVGFKAEAIEESKTSEMICARGYAQGQPPAAGPDYFVCHQVIETEDGVEVRSKYWIGWTVRYGKDYKQLPDGFRMPPVFAMGVLIKNMQELDALANVLPKLYAENHK